MLIKTLVVGHLGTNCYVVTDEDSLLCAVIDPGDESSTILDYMEDNHLQCKAIMLTHGHFDHTGAVRALMEETGAPLHMHLADCGSGHHRFDAPDGTYFYDDGDCVNVGALEFHVIATPGHTPGGVCYYFEDDKLLLSGDTLFNGSIGRTDFPGGSMTQMVESLRKLMTLPEDTLVIPGHGSFTSIGAEKRQNPYIA